MPRKRTKEEALDRLASVPRVPLKGKAGQIDRLARIGAAGLIMLDPFNRLADDVITVPLDMVCIPAYQAYLINGQPALTIYIRAGETIVPTGGNVDDVEEGMSEAESLQSIPGRVPDSRKRKVTAYQKKYKAAFKKIAPKHKLKNGKWKKGGFKAAVKAAHKKAGGKK